MYILHGAVNTCPQVRHVCLLFVTRGVACTHLLSGTVSTGTLCVLVVYGVYTFVVRHSFHRYALCSGCVWRVHVCCPAQSPQVRPVFWLCRMCKRMLYGTVSTAMCCVLVLQDMKTCIVRDSFHSHVLCVSPAGCEDACCTGQLQPVCWLCRI